MHMIGHQAIGLNVDASVNFSVGKEIDVSLVVGGREKCFLTPIPALGHMVWVAGNNHPCHSGHNVVVLFEAGSVLQSDT